MPDCFEILHKDLAGRIGRLMTPHGTVETPCLMPVINPHLELISPSELSDMGIDMIITNSYIIYQDPKLKSVALEKGLHEMLDFSGTIMTDSGAFQLSVYGDIDVQPLEILQFQLAIKSDISVPLDIPTPPDVPLERAESELQITEERLAEAQSIDRSNLLAGPIQGSTHLALRERAAKYVRDLSFDIFPVGGVVPLMEAYRYRDLVDVVTAAKKGLGSGKPVHLFGAGHPMVFALASALGCDLFDSAAYALYAREGRYLTVNGTYKLDQMKYLPCPCPVCIAHNPGELALSPEKTRLLAMHNLYVSLQEIKQVRQSIREGSLWELLETRCRSHPKMLEALKRIGSNAKWIERLDRSSKSTFFYLSEEAANRPEVMRPASRIDRISLGSYVLVSENPVKNNDEFDNVLLFKPPFGPYPQELMETYPFNAEVPDETDERAIEIAASNLDRLMAANPKSKFTLRLSEKYKGKIDRIPRQASAEIHSAL